MHLLWAVLAAAGAVAFAVLAIVAVRRIAQQRNSNAGGRLAEVVASIASMAVSVFLTVLAWSNGSQAGLGLHPGPSATQLASTTASPSLGAPSSDPTTSEPPTISPDVVKIVNLSTRPGYVDVTVRVDGPPTTGTQYLLVIQFTGQFQLKGKVPGRLGEHTIPADVRKADPLSWRDFCVIGAAPAAVKQWQASTRQPLLQMPKGSTTLSECVAQQMPA